MTSDAKIDQGNPTLVWDILKRIDICMFVTFAGNVPRGRPMSTIAMQHERAIYLLTEPTTSAAEDVAKNGTVLLSYQGGGDHAAVSGMAAINTDKTLVKRLWSPGAQAFWPDGPEDSHVVVIVVNPASADYWDGPNPVVAAAKFLFGFVSGKTPQLGERGRTDL